MKLRSSIDGGTYQRALEIHSADHREVDNVRDVPIHA